MKSSDKISHRKQKIKQSDQSLEDPPTDSTETPLRPVPVTHSRSLPTLPSAAQVPLTRTLSTPEPYRPLLSRAGSAFHFIRKKSDGVAAQTELGTSAFRRVEERRGMGSKLLSNVRGAIKRRSGRENPARPLGEEEWQGGEDIGGSLLDNQDDGGDDVYSISDEGGAPILGQYHLLEDGVSTEQSPVYSVEVSYSSPLIPRPPSIDINDIESPNPLTEEALEPEGSPAYHPLVDELDEHDQTSDFPKHGLVSPHDSPAHASSGGNTAGTESSANDADYEVRQANRRRDNDGNATVHSSSTTSSYYRDRAHSPPRMREGATMPVQDLFFRTQDMTLTPMAEPKLDISNFLSVPKHPVRRDAGHSPHTVSSASVSNTSSSGSETKKPLKFVAYKETGADLGFKLEPPSRRLIQPRISTGQKPPIRPIRPSPGTRKTPTPVTPRADTPQSPPVIVDRGWEVAERPRPVKVGEVSVVTPEKEGR